MSFNFLQPETTTWLTSALITKVISLFYGLEKTWSKSFRRGQSFLLRYYLWST